MALGFFNDEGVFVPTDNSETALYLCPHEKYGDRIPTHEDILALVKVLDLVAGANVNDRFDSTLDLMADVVVSYCRQFRNVAGPEKGATP